jgi:hypothetical protein
MKEELAGSTLEEVNPVKMDENSDIISESIKQNLKYK